METTYGKIDIVVADAAIQRWVPLLEMEDADWRDVIDNNLNGTANTVRAFAPNPECNVLIPVGHYAEDSKEPAAKSVPVRIVQSSTRDVPE